MVVRMKNPQEQFFRAARMEGVNPSDLVMRLYYAPPYRKGLEVLKLVKKDNFCPWESGAAFVSLKEVCYRLSMSKGMLLALVHRKIIPKIRVGNHWVISRTVALTLEKIVRSEQLSDFCNGRVIDPEKLTKPKDMEAVDWQKVRHAIKQWNRDNPASSSQPSPPQRDSHSHPGATQASTLPARVVAQWGDAPE